MIAIKICGLRTIEHAQTAAEAGANMVGFTFAPSKRQITPDNAATIIAAVRDGQHVLRIVGLFVNEQPARIAAIAEQCTLDAIQLSGDETVDVLGELPALPVFKAVRLAGDKREHAWLESDPGRVTLLVDAHVAGQYGGTGSIADWNKAAHLARQRPVLLAGGLRTENVGAAIAEVRPWGVDISSGVEREGQKSSALIRGFIQAARVADEQTRR